MNLKFKTKRTYSVKFFYPWETIANEGVDGMILAEEVIELIWNQGNYQERIADILRRIYSVRDWDWEDDGDDYIEVFFKENTDSDQLTHDVEEINQHFSNEWDKLVRAGRENLQIYTEADDNGAHYWSTRHTPKEEICSNCGDSVDRCDCQLMDNNDIDPDERGWDANIPEVSGVWDTNAPEPKEKDGWNVWNR